MADIAIKLVIAYLLGSLMGALIIGKLKGGVDIRTQGSGNAGGTNALRTQGGWFALGVMIIDIGKGVVATALLPYLHFGLASVGYHWLPWACGGVAVIGHVYPLWFGFRGGKGAATLVGVVAVTAPLALVAMLAVWAVTLILSGYVGLSTILAGWVLPAYLLARGHFDTVLVFALFFALLLTFTHRSNIARLLEGNENRFERAMIFNRKRNAHR